MTAFYLPARVGILGFGTVGQSVAKILTERPPAGVRLTHIFNRGIARKRADWVGRDVTWTESIDAVFASDANVIGEVNGGRDPAGAWVRRALESGRSVVTANKQLIAHEGAELARLAATARRHLRFEAAVAGGIPVIGALRNGISGDRLIRLTGILNGTCNYILTSMAKGGALRRRSPARSNSGSPRPIRRRRAGLTRGEAGDPSAVGCARGAVRHRDATNHMFGIGRYASTPTARSADLPRRHRSRVRPIVARSGRGWCGVVAARAGRGGGRHRGARAAGRRRLLGGGRQRRPTAVAVVSDLAAIALLEPERDVAAPEVERGRSSSSRAPAPIVRDRPGILAVSRRRCRARHQHRRVLQLPHEHKDALPFVRHGRAVPAGHALGGRKNRGDGLPRRPAGGPPMPRTETTCERDRSRALGVARRVAPRRGDDRGADRRRPRRRFDASR